MIRSKSDLAGERVTVTLYGRERVLTVADWVDRVPLRRSRWVALETEYQRRAGGTVPDDQEVLYGIVEDEWYRDILVHRCEVRR